MKKIDTTVKVLWQTLGDIPIDGDERIEQSFKHFPAGTHREDIWYWFEDEFNVSVAVDLMGTKSDTLVKSPSLDDLLEVWTVSEPRQWENDHGPPDWFAVCNDSGIVAYFGNGLAAYRFRLAEINRALNG